MVNGLFPENAQKSKTTLGFLSDCMDKERLAQILRMALKRYINWPYQKALKISDDTILEESSGTNPGDVDYWQIELSIVQCWEEQGYWMVQMLAVITDGKQSLGGVIDFSSSGKNFLDDHIVEFINGVPKPLLLQNSHE